MVGWARLPKPAHRALLPPGLRTSPGPAAVVASRFTASPVGAYDELTVAVPARVGLRPGLAAVLAVVNNAEARLGARRNWGLPAELGTLVWSMAAGGAEVLRWEERDIEVMGERRGPGLPILVPLRSVQRRSDGPVVVPRRLWGLARAARVSIEVETDDDFAWLAGPHPGAMVSGSGVVMQPARRPIGLLSSLRAPLWAPEPALATDPLQCRLLRAHSSVG